MVFTRCISSSEALPTPFHTYTSTSPGLFIRSSIATAWTTRSNITPSSSCICASVAPYSTACKIPLAFAWINAWKRAFCSSFDSSSRPFRNEVGFVTVSIPFGFASKSLISPAPTFPITPACRHVTGTSTKVCPTAKIASWVVRYLTGARYCVALVLTVVPARI